MATESEVPEFYVDQFTVTAGTYGLTMTFGLTPPHPAPGQAAPSREVARLRMSLEHAKVMAMILRFLPRCPSSTPISTSPIRS